jgi:outer membrane autotransporter protein
LLEDEAQDEGGGSGDGSPYSIYASFVYLDKDYDTQSVPGLDSDTYGGVIGASLRGDRYFAGLAVDFSREDAKYKESAGKQDTDEFGLQLYGTYYPQVSKNLFLSGALRFGRRDIDTKRNVRTSTVDGGVARGSTDAGTLGLLGGAGYSLPLGGRTLIGLSGWLVWNRNETDGYAESGATVQVADPNTPLSGNLRFEDDNYSTFDGILTATLLHTIPVTNGRVTPSAFVSYVHEFESDTRTIRAQVIDTTVTATPQSVSFRTNDADKNYFRVGAALTADFNQGTTLFAAYRGTVGHDWRDENLFTIGFNQAF